MKIEVFIGISGPAELGRILPVDDWGQVVVAGPIQRNIRRNERRSRLKRGRAPGELPEVVVELEGFVAVNKRVYGMGSDRQRAELRDRKSVV